jgi:transcriptional regulator with XRE-family HTH domain
MRRREDENESAEERPEWLVWLVGALADKGYDLSSERTGDRAKLARDTGLSASIIARLVSGQQVSYESLLALARSTGIPVMELLIRTGKATEDDFSLSGEEFSQIGVQSGKRLTPEEVAVAAGVPEEDQAWFATMVRRLKRRGIDEGDSSAGGAAAEG